MRPAMNVSAMLMRISKIAPSTGRMALRVGRPVRWCTMRLMGINRISVHRMPITPAVKPSMSVSALNTREMSCLLAPMERRMPISFVRSSTEM